MITRNLARRLERLEAEITPGEDNIIVIAIQYVDSDGKVVSTSEYIVRSPARPPKRWRR